MPAPIFAHQGGWDEILLVVAPLVVVGLLLWVANRRLAKQLELTSTPPGVNGGAGGNRLPTAGKPENDVTGHGGSQSQLDDHE